LTSLLLEKCTGTARRQIIRPDTFTRDKCGGVKILSPRSFYPVGWFDVDTLYESNTDEFWQEFLKDSYSIHFFQSSRGFDTKVMKERYYGKARPALLYLATRHCPISFDSVRLF
jgi:hypothetical protein